jgi:hypothetical protein
MKFEISKGGKTFLIFSVAVIGLGYFGFTGRPDAGLAISATDAVHECRSEISLHHDNADFSNIEYQTDIKADGSLNVSGLFNIASVIDKYVCQFDPTGKLIDVKIGKSPA